VHDGERSSHLIRRLDSTHDERRLDDFRKAAEPYARSAAVKEFDAKHRALIESGMHEAESVRV
jgi:hypothetical protein